MQRLGKLGSYLGIGMAGQSVELLVSPLATITKVDSHLFELLVDQPP